MPTLSELYPSTAEFKTVDGAGIEAVRPLMRALTHTAAVTLQEEVRDLAEKGVLASASVFEGSEDEVLTRLRGNLEAVYRKRGFDYWKATKYGSSDGGFLNVGALIPSQPPYIYAHFIRRTADDRYALYPADPPSYQMR